MNCKRCGTCCEKGGPALHRQDLPLFRQGVLTMAHCVTHRKGELLYDQIKDKVMPLARELVKIASPGRKAACLFYRPGECSIHENRPAECRALDCEETEKLAAMYAAERITRLDLVAPGSAMAELMADHERECDLEQLALLAGRVHKSGRDKDAYDQLLAMHGYDKAVREKVQSATRAPEQVLSFFFGRPLTALFPTFGLRCLDQGGKTLLIGIGG